MTINPFHDARIANVSSEQHEGNPKNIRTIHSTYNTDDSLMNYATATATSFRQQLEELSLYFLPATVLDNHLYSLNENYTQSPCNSSQNGPRTPFNA